jgi:hypothetical protein
MNMTTQTDDAPDMLLQAAREFGWGNARAGDKDPMKTAYPAQIVFTEVERVTGPRRWTGRLLRRSACVDVAWRGGATRPRAVTWTPYFDISEDPQSGRCAVTLNGGSTPHSLRHASYPDVATAQEAGIRWAGRRFRIPVQVTQ